MRSDALPPNALREALSSVCRIRGTVVEEPGFISARVELKGVEFLAEAAPDRTQPGVWPEVPGVLRHSAEKRLENGVRVMVFRTQEGRLLSEDRGSMDEAEVVGTVVALAGILRNLHSRGTVLGYVGPESVLRSPDGSVQLLAGLRGVPDSPFSAPEAVGSHPIDPRSDVYALGTLATRLLSGSDDREAIIAAWGRMDPSLRAVIDTMVSESPDDRHSNLSEAVEALRLAGESGDLPEEPGSGAGEPAGQEPPPGNAAGRSRPGRGRLPAAVIAVLALAAALFILLSPAEDGRGEAPGPAAADTADVAPPDTASAPPTADTLPTVDPGAVVWVSNCTGTEGAASAFREGPARDFVNVFPSTGAVRDSSILLVRRRGAGSGAPDSLLALHLAGQDSVLRVVPVDVTIMLGTDLSYAGFNEGAFTAPSSPTDTLYVDIVNQGIQYRLDGQGAASWLASRLAGRSLAVEGAEYLLEVVDTRDGDRVPNEELGFPGVLGSTFFMYAVERPGAAALESAVRTALQAVPDETSGAGAVPVPDAWVLLGRDRL